MVARLREIAEDRSRPVGIAGHKVYGTAEALLLAITGRPIGRDELTGPGATQLYQRLR
jgi:hypothetical protein